MNLNSLDAIEVERWRRTESVLDAAFELEPREVAAYLDRACANSPELRREVEALLEADQRASAFMAVPAAAMVNPFADGELPSRDGLPTNAAALDGSTASASAAPVRRSPIEPPPPARIGHYTVQRELGRGGMGIVYLGRDETLDRFVALKALPGAVAADPARLARFLSEAKLLGALHHPNIASIHGIERAGDQRYLVLERIEGDTLSERLRGGVLPLAAALDFTLQIADALAAAHAEGIVHRDLKPGNVMVTPGGLVKVLDFGLAIHVSQRNGEPKGAQLGTPGYMSPEQVLGLAQDARADLFALGVVLYQCLTGARAFAGTSAYAVLAATLNAAPDLSRLPTGTPIAVRTLLERLLEKDPQSRLADAREAAAILAAAAPARIAPRTGVGRAARGIAGAPEPTSPFIGREREIGALLGLLERVRVVTLGGASGLGKSRLAIEAAGSVLQDECEIWYADVSVAADSAGVAASIAAAAGVRSPDEAALAGAIAAKLAGRTALLVLDNCDLGLAACTTLATTLLERAPGLRILATSRERLSVPGEQVMRVAPLGLPDPEATPTLAGIAATESARMFVACAALHQPGFELSEANARDVGDICRLLEGVPLSIELAASLLRHQSLESILRDLEERLEDARATAQREPSESALSAAMQLSYDRLGNVEQHFFRALSAFAGGFGTDAAAAIAASEDEFAALDLLTRLLDLSLISIQRADRMAPRYRMLEPVRQLATARAQQAREAAALHDRHLDWFLAEAELAAPSLLSGPDQARCLASLEADHANLLAALQHCASATDGAGKALRLTGAVWLFWYVRGHFTRGRRALEWALALPGAEAPSRPRAQALFAAGGLALYQGDYAEGLALSQAAHDLYAHLGDRIGIARSLSHLALCESGVGRYAAASGRYATAIAIFREAGDVRRLSATLNNLGALMRQQGDFAAARVNHEEALALFREADDRDGMVVTLVNLGLAAARLGDDAAAGGWVDDALLHIRDLRARRAAPAALEVAAEVLAHRGHTEGAARLMGAAQTQRTAMSLTADTWWKHTQQARVEQLRTALGAAHFASLAAAGGLLSFEETIEVAHRALAPPDTAVTLARTPEKGPS